LTEGKKEFCRYQMRYLIKAGSERSNQVGDFCWIEAHARLTLDAAGNIIGTSGTLRDITELKQAEEAVHKLNAELEKRVRQRTAELSWANELLAQEIDERQQAQEALQQRADMENLIATISTRFIDIASEDLDQGFNWALQIIGEFTQVDNSYIFMLTNHGALINNTHNWCAPEVEPLSHSLMSFSAQEAPWWMALLWKFEPIKIPCVADLPAEARREKELLEACGIQSAMIVPLVSAGILRGFVGFNSVRIKKNWSDTDATLLRRVGEIFANTIERQWAASEMHRRNCELTLLNQVIDASMSALEPAEVLSIACRELVHAFNLVQAQAILFNETKSEARVVAEAFRFPGLSDPNKVICVSNNPLLRQVLAQKSPLTIDSTGPMPGPFQIGDLLDTECVTVGLVLPLGMNDEVVGVLSLGIDQPQAFSSQDFNLFWSVADQISVTLTQMHLAQNQRRLATIIDQIIDVVVIIDTEGRIIYLNPAFEQTTGYSQAEVLNQTSPLLKSYIDDPVIYDELWSTISAGQPWQGRLINKKKNGVLYTCETTIMPVYNEHRAIINYVAVGRDVTQTLQLEEQYRQVQKMESIGRLAGGIAHDFNNILTAIMGYTGLSLRGLPADSPVRADLQGIEASSQRAANLTRQLLAFARRQVIESKPVNLTELITGASKILRRLITEVIELVILADANPGWVTADPGQLEQVLFNLSVNARDAMPQGGKLIVETSHVTLGRADASAYPQIAMGDYVLLTVSDTGSGMSNEVKTHIFEPFFTTKEPGKGTGLGLATCFGIIKQSGGHILVDSELNKGTTFRIYLPRLSGVGHSAAVSHEKDLLPGGAETILIVEDEPMARDTSARTLRKLGYTVLEAENGEEALREIDKLGGEKIQLLISDLIMPQLGGKALIEKIKPVYPAMKVILTSGYTDEIISQQYMSDLGVTFLQKPFSPATMAVKVRDLLDHSSSLAA
jgi:PAS domain S-box-containing protein